MRAPPFVPLHEFIKRYKDKPPSYIFKKTRAMMSLLASLFLFDSFPQYSLSKIMEYCGKRSNLVDGSCRKYNLLSIFESQSILFGNFVEKYIFTCVQSIWKPASSCLLFFRGLPFKETILFIGLSFSGLRHRLRCRSPPASEIKILMILD